MPYPEQPKDTPIPPKLDKWNWGAFFLNWIWGIGNSTYIAFLMFVPFVNFIFIFILGAKGSQWAWKNRIWENEEHFIRTQRNWARMGCLLPLIITALAGALIFGIFSIMKNSDAYKISMREVRANTEVIEILGSPITPGWLVFGSINVDANGSGKAYISIPIFGPKGDGKVESSAIKSNGIWQLQLLKVRIENSGKVITIIGKKEMARKETPSKTHLYYR